LPLVFSLDYLNENITGITCPLLQLKSMSEEKCVSIQVPSNPLTSVTLHTLLYFHTLFWNIM